MREIGSEFWNIPICGKENGLFSTSIRWFLSGRSALQYIIEDIKEKRAFHTVAMPSWCCDSMIVPFLRNGIEVKFYPVYGSRQDQSAVNADAILLMDYFGYTGQSELTGYEGTVIRDITHSIFSSSYNDADFYFGSLRKWAGFWTGGYAWGAGTEIIPTADEKYVALRKSAMEVKKEYISGASDSKDYLKAFNEAEEYLDSCGVAAAEPRDVTLAQNLDIESIKAQRKKNAKRLLEAFADIAVFQEMKETDCPMAVPILVPQGKRNELRRYLIEQEIYCPIHWPVSKYHKLNDNTRKLYDEELSLVCDQRYTEEDMDRIIMAIKNFWKE